MLPKLFASPDPAVVGAPWQQVEGMILKAPVPGIVGALTAMRDRPDSTGLLPLLAGIPTLVIVGEEDRLTPLANSRTMAELIPGAQLAVIPGAGHLAPVESPAETTRAIAEFLKTRD
jgi:pimeloyl-ACP methyl ester carboxylesterase